MNKKLEYSLISIAIIVVLSAIFIGRKPNPPVAPSADNYIAPATTTTPTKGILYKNNEYGFDFYLPENWEGYSVVEEEWEGYSLDAQGSQTLSTTGPFVSIRHPDWEYKSPRQDIPIFIFTISQWNDMENDKFHIGAAPINPSEIGRNKKYVFALPARYNFSYITGYEEVEEILKNKPLKPF